MAEKTRLEYGKHRLLLKWLLPNGLLFSRF